MWFCKHSIPIKCRILGILLVHIGLEIHNVTIQIVSITEIIIFIISHVMSIHIPLWCLNKGVSNFPLWCILGIIV